MIIHRNSWFWGNCSTIVAADGFGLCRLSVEYNDNIAYLSDVIVYPDHQGQGIGNMLLEAAESEARRMGAIEIHLWTIPGSWMIGWYGRHGYLYQWTDKNGNVVMKKRLKNE